MKSRKSKDNAVVRENNQLKKGLRLAERALTNISKETYDILDNDLTSDVDLYGRVYKMNQQAHEALVPLKLYCLEDDVKDS